MKIDRISARAIPDTRGRLTVETTLFAGTLSASASVPSGKSTGSREAREVDAARAIEHVHGEISAVITARDFASPEELDQFLIALDGTPDKSRLGANALLSVSLSAMRLFALLEGLPLWQAIAKRAGTTPAAPRLFVNVMNGGAHAEFRLPFQEYLLVIEGSTSAALPIAQVAFAELGRRLGPAAGGVPLGEEGGYAPAFETIDEPFQHLSVLAKEHVGVSLAIDAAASQLFSNGAYHLLGGACSAAELADLYEDLADRFPLTSIEDPFYENAHDDFARLTKRLGEKVAIVGDDLTVTDPRQIMTAAAHNEITAVIIKPNQIGTLSEALQAVQEARAAGIRVIASHRSGETADTFIADFAYGVGAYGLKAGGLAQPERRAKYERLLAIEREVRAV